MVPPPPVFGRATGRGAGAVGRGAGAGGGEGATAGRAGGGELVCTGIGTWASAETGTVLTVGAGAGGGCAACGGVVSGGGGISGGGRVGAVVAIVATGAGASELPDADQMPTAASATAPAPRAIQRGRLERRPTSNEPVLSFASARGKVAGAECWTMRVWASRSGEPERAGTTSAAPGTEDVTGARTETGGPNGVGAGADTGGGASAAVRALATMTESSGGAVIAVGLGTACRWMPFVGGAGARTSACVPPAL